MPRLWGLTPDIAESGAWLLRIIIRASVRVNVVMRRHVLGAVRRGLPEWHGAAARF